MQRGVAVRLPASTVNGVMKVCCVDVMCRFDVVIRVGDAVENVRVCSENVAD